MNNELQVLTMREFNEVRFNCYREDGHDDIGYFWATSEQIGQLLGYTAPDVAIRKIHKRNKERLDKFSTRTNVRPTPARWDYRK